jgi:triphosphatase
MLEVEAKFALESRVTADQIEALDWTPFTLGERHVIDQRDTFFDTAELALSRTRHAVRIRQAGSDILVTLKGPGTIKDGLHSREEIELPLTHSSPEAWPDAIRSRIVALIGDQDVRPILTVHNLRTTWPLFRDGRVMGEVALDEGSIVANDAQEPMHELEVELKGGRVEDIDAVRLLVLRQLPAHPEDRSKFARGIALIQPEIVRSVDESGSGA